MYACPVAVPVKAFVARSCVVPAAVWLSWMDPEFVPVTPVVSTVTVHVAEGAPPLAVGALIVSVPVIPLVVSPKVPAFTVLTGSLNVTVHESGPELANALAAVRLIDDTVGAVVS